MENKFEVSDSQELLPENIDRIKEELSDKVDEVTDRENKEATKGELSLEGQANNRSIKGLLKERLHEYAQTVMGNKIVAKIALSPALPILLIIAGQVAIYQALDMASASGAMGVAPHDFLASHTNQTAVGLNEKILEGAGSLNDHSMSLNPLIYNDNGTATSFKELMAAHPDVAQALEGSSTALN